ncbi:MAG: aldehyde dehydrogenase family protein [Verrucomicrobia bacterium]|jgi:acyl-CoA reductase-like NAD-dependent aldehyde dehydrogenase|nr:aldehyde dehydrogenase family protein [Verrucomicrobiota bacterium]
MLQKKYPLYIANRPEQPNSDLAVSDKFSGETATRVAQADAALVDRGIAAAVEAAGPMAAMAPYERRSVLDHCVRRFRERFDELADALRIEAGKPINDSRGEVTRLIDTFQIAADESVRAHGEALNLEISERTRGYRGWTKRVPIGPCSFISPFNFPLNLTAHKVAPAIAAGCPFVLKPASRTPIGALLIGEILAETDLPAGAFSILPCSRDAADRFTTDERLKLLSFTGSPEVGWALKAKAGKKQVVLELGGNAACVIDAGADLDDAIPRVIKGAFYQSGQSCISVQRILVHESLADEFEAKFVEATRELKSGDPAEEETFIGPMIAASAAERLESWIHEAREAGAELLCGGSREGALHAATVLKNVPRDQKLQREEAFGPIAIIDTFDDFDAALDQVNDSAYGIHAGVFTPRIDHAMQAWDRLDVGGVLINEVPSWRVDNLPYGGVKDSGIGREGIRYAMDDMSEIRSLVFRDV